VKILVSNLGKRYGFQFVIRKVDFTIDYGEILGLSGRNGAGKSTIMQMVSGYLSPSEGSVRYEVKDQVIERENIYTYISYTAPYIDMPPKLTIEELFNHYKFFKKVSMEHYKEFIEYCEIDDQGDKFIENFSSGMKQKIALGLNLVTLSDLMLFDEPTSYLDSQAKEWFYKKILLQKGQKTVIIASNDSEDFKNCDRIYEIQK
jgi:ABC-type multidrug transport system ATPase subunit